MRTDPKGLACIPCLLVPLTVGTGLSLWWQDSGGPDAIPDPFRNDYEGGSADGPAPYDKFDENEAKDFVPNPFGGGDECDRLKWAINVLRAQIAWRYTDLNPSSASYYDHLMRIKGLEAQLERLEEAYRNICGGECPVT